MGDLVPLPPGPALLGAREGTDVYVYLLVYGERRDVRSETGCFLRPV